MLIHHLGQSRFDRSPDNRDNTRMKCEHKSDLHLVVQIGCTLNQNRANLTTSGWSPTQTAYRRALLCWYVGEFDLDAVVVVLGNNAESAAGCFYVAGQGE